MEAAKRPAENGANGDSENGAKKSKLDPECGRLLFCGTTEWHNVRSADLSSRSFLIDFFPICRHSNLAS